MSCCGDEQAYRERFEGRPTKTSLKIQQLVEEGVDFHQTNLFAARQVAARSVDTDVNEIAKLTLDTAALSQLYNSDDEHPTLQLPGADGQPLTLLLEKVKVYSDGFKVYQDGVEVHTDLGHHYFGVVQGVTGSYAILNVWPDRVTGIVRVENQPYELARDITARDLVQYSMRKGRVEGVKACGTDTGGILAQAKQVASRAPTTNRVRLYFDALDNNTTDITTLFTATQNIYIDDPDVEVPLELAGISLWSGTVPWTYTGSADGTSLDAYSEYRYIQDPNNDANTSTADAYMFVPTQTTGTGTGIAWVGTLCGKTRVIVEPSGFSYFGPYSISIISAGSIGTNPAVFNLNAAVVAHELGHNCGSLHTFQCVWERPAGTPNQSLGGCGIGAETCYPCSDVFDASNPTENACLIIQPGETQPEGQTIMGYCEGYTPMVFGPQPGAVVRSGVQNASCLLCVHGNTPILMADGTHKSIKDLKRGDWVASDINISKKYQIAQVSISKYDPCEAMDVVVFQPGSLGPNTPQQPLTITGGHAIFYQGVRREARCFKNFPGVTYYGSIEGEELFELTEDFMVAVYDLQFEDDGSYVAAGVQVQSRSPWSVYTPLAKELYFNPEMYRPERTYNSFNQVTPYSTETIQL